MLTLPFLPPAFSLSKRKVAVFSSKCPYQISPSKTTILCNFLYLFLSLSLSRSLSSTSNHQLLAFSSLRLLYCIATIIQVHSPNAFKPKFFPFNYNFNNWLSFWGFNILFYAWLPRKCRKCKP